MRLSNYQITRIIADVSIENYRSDPLRNLAKTYAYIKNENEFHGVKKNTFKKNVT